LGCHSNMSNWGSSARWGGGGSGGGLAKAEEECGNWVGGLVECGYVACCLWGCG